MEPSGRGAQHPARGYSGGKNRQAPQLWQQPHPHQNANAGDWPGHAVRPSPGGTPRRGTVPYRATPADGPGPWQQPPGPPPRGGFDERGRFRWRARSANTAGTRLGNWARGLTGSLAAGLLVLTLGLVGVQFWAAQQGQEGPWVSTIVAHGLGAAVALVLQALGDRRRDALGGAAIAGVLVVVVGTLWFWWWL